MAFVAEAHDPLHASPVVPASVEDDHLAGGREVAHVALEVHLRLLPVGRRREGDDSEHAGADSLGDRLDGAALAGRIPTLEHDAHFGTGRLHPLLHGDELSMQRAEAPLILLLLHPRPKAALGDARRFAGFGHLPMRAVAVDCA